MRDVVKDFFEQVYKAKAEGKDMMILKSRQTHTKSMSQYPISPDEVFAEPDPLYRATLKAKAIKKIEEGFVIGAKVKIKSFGFVTITKEPFISGRDLYFTYKPKYPGKENTMRFTDDIKLHKK